MIIYKSRIIFLWYLLAAFIIPVLTGAAPVVVSGGPDNDYESWIIRMNDGRLMVIFDRNPDWASGDLYVTFSTDNGVTWAAVTPIIIETGDQATLTFVQLPCDTLRVWYASNEAGNYAIYTAYSLDGLTWIRQGAIDLGWSSSSTYYDPTVILEPDSSLTMSYRVQGSGGYIAHCPNHGNWDTLRTLVAPSGNRTRVMKHANGTYLYAYHRRSGPGQYDYDVFIKTATDRVFWSDSVRLTTNLNSHDPFPNEGADGAYVVYYAKYVSPAYNLYRRRSYNTTTWLTEEQITSDAVYNTQPHFFVESGDVYLVWAHAIVYETNNDVYFERSADLAVAEHEPSAIGSRARVFPTPGCGRISIIPASMVSDRARVVVYSSSGQLVGSAVRQGEIFCIDTSPLPAGVYFVNIDDGDRRQRAKFTVLKP
ncbi:MAG TPA: T9SS type A sorting domain-containing protein [bacterium]